MPKGQQDHGRITMPVPITARRLDKPLDLSLGEVFSGSIMSRRQECERCQQTVSSLDKRSQKLGGKLLSAYVTTGQYDVVLTLDMPNGEAMAKFASAISGSGNARTTTVRGYTPDEFSKLVAEAPKF